MSKVTTRLNNQDIVNLTKHRYESQQRSKLPTVIVDLSSKGLIYPETSPLRTGQVEMRYMTAYDEDILTNISYIKNGIMFDKLLESIIISDIDVSERSSTDKDGLIINARILAYGKEYPVTVKDPESGVELARVVDLSALQSKPFLLESDADGEFTYQLENGTEIKFTYLVKLDNVTTVSEILNKIITQVRDSRSKEDIEYFIRYEFLSADAKRFRDFYAKNAPGIDYNCEFEGENGGTFTAGFQLGTNLFWF
jgi:hypothetical protein